MPKISRPVAYTAFLAGCVVVYLLATPQTPPPARHTVHITRRANVADASGMTPEDLSANFPRYTGGGRNPFIPGVLASNQQMAGKNNPLGKSGVWALTGINVINGVESAVVENSATGDSVFLSRGDKWNGLRVLSVGTDAVVFENALGQRTQLAFAQPADENTGAPGSAGPVPSLSQIRPLPPLAPSITVNNYIRPAAAQAQPQTPPAPADQGANQ